MPCSDAAHTICGCRTHHTLYCGFQTQALRAQCFLLSPMVASISFLPFQFTYFCCNNFNSASLMSTIACFPTLVILHSSSSLITFPYFALSSVFIMANRDFLLSISLRLLLYTESAISTFERPSLSLIMSALALSLYLRRTLRIPLGE